MKFALKLPKWPARTAPLPDDRYDAPAKSGFDRKRVMRIAALLLIAGAAGQLVKSMNNSAAAERVAAAPALSDAPPTQIIAVSSETAAPLPQAAAAPEILPVLAAVVTLVPQETPELTQGQTETSASILAEQPELTPELTPVLTPVLVAATAEAPLPEEPLTAQPLDAACPVTLDLSVVPGAMIGVTLIAPCAPNARVVLQHEGLAVTGMTTATGALFTSLPALSISARIGATFPDGSQIEAALQVPEAAEFRRFGVQWRGADAFQVNAYQNGAEFGGAGHVYGVQPGLAADAGGFLQILGDPAAPLPLLAEIYTYPARESLVDMVVEAAVTEQTCGREIVGETISAQGGQVLVTDLTLAMPDCSAVGDFLVLNNLALDMTLAAN